MNEGHGDGLSTPMSSASKHTVEHLVSRMVSSSRMEDVRCDGVAASSVGAAEDGDVFQRIWDTAVRLSPSRPCVGPPVEQVVGVAAATLMVSRSRSSSLSADAASLGKTSTVASLLVHTIEHVVSVGTARLPDSAVMKPWPAPHTTGAATLGDSSVVISNEEEMLLHDVVA